jgi:exonuclease SbcC
MLEKALLLNFQCHTRTEVIFDPRVTVFTGMTEAGKSAALRALRWAALNEPRGKSFIQWDADEAMVKLWLDGRRVVRRIGGDQGNVYALDGERHAAPGAGVPEPVAAVVKMTDINFQRQLEPHFWMTAAAGQVAKDLNRIVNLEVIDSTTDAVAKRLRQAKAEADVCRGRLEKAKAKLESLQWVAGLVEAVKELDQLGAELATKRQALRRLGDGVAKWAEARQTLTDARYKLPALERALEEGKRARAAGDRLARLEKLIADLETATSAARPKLPDLGQLDDTVIQAADAYWRLTRIAKLTHDLEAAEKESCHARQMLRECEDRLTKALKGKCPVCQRPMATS